MITKKKSLIRILLLLIVGLVATISLLVVIKKSNSDIKIFKEKEILKLELGIFYTNTALKKNFELLSERVIINFFSPTCEHCQYMATQYLKNKAQLKDITILMVTSADSCSLTKFNNDYQLNTFHNIVLLRDTKFKIYKIFEITTVPSFFIYDHQKLVKKIIGETKIENLLVPFNSPEAGK